VPARPAGFQDRNPTIPAIPFDRHRAAKVHLAVDRSAQSGARSVFGRAIPTPNLDHRIADVCGAGGLAYVFPDYGANRIVIDGAFSPTFCAWTDLALALGWLAVLAVGVAYVLRQLLRRAA
jgi:hypothetical protein